jgi:hypothetical protein
VENPFPFPIIIHIMNLTHKAYNNLSLECKQLCFIIKFQSHSVEPTIDDKLIINVDRENGRGA